MTRGRISSSNKGERVALPKTNGKTRRSVSVSAVRVQSAPSSQPTPGTRRQPTAFGKTVRMLRASRGLSQAAVARRAFISPGYLGLLETGKRGDRPSLDMVKRFGQALTVTVDEMEALMRTAGHLGRDEKFIPGDQPTTIEVIDQDRRLTKSQKDVAEGDLRRVRRHRDPTIARPRTQCMRGHV
jgi:transcriptional regulator with XRE-family HTH domain